MRKNLEIFGMCLNWKVLAGLAVVAVGILVVAPNLILGALPILLLLACPLSMLFMMRGMGSMGNMNGQNGMQNGMQRMQQDEPSVVGMPGSQGSAPSDVERVSPARFLTRDEQLARLAEQLARVQAEQEVLAQEIAALEAPTPRAVSEAEAAARAADERIQNRR